MAPFDQQFLFKVAEGVGAGRQGAGGRKDKSGDPGVEASTVATPLFSTKIKGCWFYLGAGNIIPLLFTSEVIRPRFSIDAIDHQYIAVRVGLEVEDVGTNFQFVGLLRRLTAANLTFHNAAARLDVEAIAFDAVLPGVLAVHGTGAAIGRDLQQTVIAVCAIQQKLIEEAVSARRGHCAGVRILVLDSGCGTGAPFACQTTIQSRAVHGGCQFRPSASRMHGVIDGQHPAAFAILTLLAETINKRAAHSGLHLFTSVRRHRSDFIYHLQEIQCGFAFSGIGPIADEHSFILLLLRRREPHVKGPFEEDGNLIAVL
jgi:hypothetical protein